MVLLEELECVGCLVECLERPMSQGLHDQLVLQIRSAVAEYERTLIAERMRRGRQMKLRAVLDDPLDNGRVIHVDSTFVHEFIIPQITSDEKLRPNLLSSLSRFSAATNSDKLSDRCISSSAWRAGMGDGVVALVCEAGVGCHPAVLDTDA
jgi:hypothetical protein